MTLNIGGYLERKDEKHALHSAQVGVNNNGRMFFSENQPTPWAQLAGKTGLEASLRASP